MKLYILVKKKGASKWALAIPAKSGTTKMQLQKMLRSQLKAGFIARVVSEVAVRRVMQRQGVSTMKPKRRMSRTRRRVKRRSSLKRRVKRRTIRRSAPKRRIKRSTMRRKKK